MKKITYFLFLATGLFLQSCSSDDDNTNATPEPEQNEFLPITENSYWVYDVQGPQSESGRDSVYVAGDTVINTVTYTKIKAKSQPLGFFSNALTSGGIRKDGTKLMVSGILSVDYLEGFPLDLALTDFVVFDENATANTPLSSVSDVLEVEYESLPITASYTLATTAKETLPTYTAGGVTYTNVKRVETTLQLQITINTMFTVDILPSQNVVTSSQYYAEGIGMVHTITDFSYELEETLGNMFPIPLSGSEHQEEVLSTYHNE
jgi:hypothetical protein